MTRTTLVTLCVLLIAAVLAYQLGGREGMGVVTGVLCGTSVAMLGASWQRHTFRYRPKRAFQSVVEVFLFKLLFVLLGALCMRYIEAAASRADWKAFLVTFVIAAITVQTVAVFESVQILHGSSKPEDAPISPSAVNAGPPE